MEPLGPPRLPAEGPRRRCGAPLYEPASAPGGLPANHLGRPLGEIFPRRLPSGELRRVGRRLSGARHLGTGQEAAGCEYSLRHELLPIWKDRPLGSITRRQDVTALLDKIVLRAYRHWGIGTLGHWERFLSQRGRTRVTLQPPLTFGTLGQRSGKTKNYIRADFPVLPARKHPTRATGARASPRSRLPSRPCCPPRFAFPPKTTGAVVVPGFNLRLPNGSGPAAPSVSSRRCCRRGRVTPGRSRRRGTVPTQSTRSRRPLSCQSR